MSAEGHAPMNESRLQAYLNLIQELLNCPSSEKPQILQANSELLDLELLETCEAVAARLAERGEENKAKFLRDIASQLWEFLGMTAREDSENSEGENLQEYANFIQELLQAEQSSNSGIAVIYPMLAQRQHLLNARFAQVLQQRATHLIAKHPQAIKLILRKIENLSIDIQDFRLGKRANNIEIVITGYQIVLSNREPRSEDWANTQNNLGTAYKDRIRGDKAENIEQAIACYKAALEVRTRQAFPQDWAMTQNNLGNAYYSRIRGDRAVNIEQAIACYEAALSVRTRQDFPEQWATTQNNLGTAYHERIRDDRAQNIESAIECYKEALSVRTREDFPQDWAATQNNLANAYNDRIRDDRAQNIENAIACYKAALSVYTRVQFPVENVQTLNNLGWAYLAKLDYLNLKKPNDTKQRETTLQSAYDTFKQAITGAAALRELIKSGDEIKQKHDLQWDRLYIGMVQACLDSDRNQEALEYAEANKARNLAELIAQKQAIPKALERITYKEITQLLTTKDTVLIEWYITGKEIITFVVTYPDVLTVHRCRRWDEIADLVAEYRDDYAENKERWRTQLPAYLQRLANILDIAAILPPDCTRAILIPHWFLHLFPLHALPLIESEYLLDRFPQGIQYAPSCQLLQQIQTQSSFNQLLALQNPTSDLAYTELEVASIAPKFSISQILPGREASKANLLEQYLEQLENAHCAHFSCHGFFDPNAPLRSALILSGGIISEAAPRPEPQSPLLEPGDTPLTPPCQGGTLETRGENSVKVPLFKEDLGGSNRYISWRKGQAADITKCLTLAEIFQLQLKKCRLVVLSACETALIDTTNRSDYIGLPTGFLYAGAMGTIASLWAVNDLSTALIMVKFYELLKPGVSIGMALHETQRWFKSATTLELLNWVENADSFDASQKKAIGKELKGYNSEEKPYGDVYHWGAFCAIGL